MADSGYPLVATEAGRSLVAQLETPLAQLLKRLALHPRLAPVRRLLGGWRGPLAALAVVELLRRKVKAQTRRLVDRLDGGKQGQKAASPAPDGGPGVEGAKAASPAPGSGHGAEDAKATSETPDGSPSAKGAEATQATKPSQAVAQPQLRTLLAGKDGAMGLTEIAGTVACVVLGSFFMIQKSQLMGMIIVASNEGGFTWRFLWHIVQYPFLAMLSTALTESSVYMQSKLALRWRRNVTYKLHSLYFSRMVYYRIQTESKESLITDPDIRICSDVKETIGMIAGLAVQFTSAVTYTVMFSRATAKHRGLGWSLFAPGFFLSAIAVVLQVQPADAALVLGSLQQFTGRLKQLLTRVQLHAERICMLQGEEFEQDRLQAVVKDVKTWGLRQQDRFFISRWLELAVFRSPEHAAVIEATGFFCGAAMGAGDTMARAAREGLELPLDPNRPVQWAPGQLAAQFVGTYGFFDACSGWGSFVGAFFQFQNFSQVTDRLKQLYARLQYLHEHGSSGGAEVFTDSGSSISFQGVSISTPTGQLLLKDLTFSVAEGQTLLICGHNGAGKSSIMRCLCSLWPILEGKITRPGGAVQAEEDVQLHEQIYYLPQKPCNVLGSLSDQLTYPMRLEGGLPEDELRRWLRYVDLEHLVDRQAGAAAVSRVEGTADAGDIDWEVLLSLGEQQALSIARLLYHHPRFAILDECTSAVGKVIEQRLFEVAREAGISCITIAHRPALREHHSQLLQLTGNLKEDGKGWVLTELPHTGGALSPTKPWTRDTAEVQRRVEAQLDRERLAKGRAGAGSYTAASAAAAAASPGPGKAFGEQHPQEHQARSSGTAAGATVSLARRTWPSLWQRLVAAVRLGLPTPRAKRRGGLRIGIAACLCGVRAGLFWRYYCTMSAMMRASVVGDLPLATTAFLTTVAAALTSTFVDACVAYQAGVLEQEMSANAVEHLARRMLQGASLVTVMRPPAGGSLPTVENPALRLAEVRELFNQLLTNCSVFMPCANLLYTLPLTVRAVGLASPLCSVVLFFLYRGSQLLVPDLAAIQARMATLESRFQVLHTRLRTIAEPVAFSGGGAAERAIVEPHFDAILSYSERTERRQTLYKICRQFFMDQRSIPVAMQRSVAALFASRNVPKHPDGVSANTVCSNFLFDRAQQMPLIAVKALANFSDALGTIDGHCIRVLELVAALDALGSPVEGEAAPKDGKISVHGLDLVTPSGARLAKSLTFEAAAGVPTVVTGPNASGKSLLGCVLMGLWPVSGQDARLVVAGATSARPPLETLMPAPQRIYLSGGSLAAQLAYPAVLQMPTEPPFAVRVATLPADVGEGALLRHFEVLGPCTCRLVADSNGTYGVVDFNAAEAMLRAVARPHDRVLDGRALVCELAMTDTGAAGTQLPRFARMRSCLHTSGIEHILEREEDGWLAERAWEDTLSGGEQQRLCFARVLYRGPAFALLDECTSMVATDAEEALYRQLFHEWGVTPLTLTQRMFMPDLYVQEVSLGVPNATGWELVERRGPKQQ